MAQDQHQFTVSTSGAGLYEVTAEIVQWVTAQGMGTGLLTVYCPHTSASLVIQENADPDVVRDLDDFFKALVAEGAGLYRHTSEGADDMPAHIRAALTATSLSIPVADHGPALGTWQGIFLFEHRARPHERRVLLHLTGG
jgi:secondary thiamine-phosphate synthase enzyme